MVNKTIFSRSARGQSACHAITYKTRTVRTAANCNNLDIPEKYLQYFNCSKTIKE